MRSYRHTVYVLLITFPWHRLSRERASVLLYTCIVCPVEISWKGI